MVAYWLVSMSIVLRHFSHFHSSGSLVLPASQAKRATAEERRVSATSKSQSANASPPSLPTQDPRTARVTSRALSTAGISNESATSRSDAGAAARARPGMNEHCATSLLSLSSFQVHRFFQHPRQHAPLLNIKGMLVRLLAHWLVSMSIVLRHFSHFHSFRFTGSSSIPGNTRHC
jgi:hypothetical protein